MALPADFIVAQNVIVYDKATLQPTVVRCNCSHNPPHLTARHIQNNRDKYWTPSQFAELQNSGTIPV